MLPGELLAQLDLYGDPYDQIDKIFRHYTLCGYQREQAKLLDLEPKARGTPPDDHALKEMTGILKERAKRRGTTEMDELRRLLEDKQWRSET